MQMSGKPVQRLDLNLTVTRINEVRVVQGQAQSRYFLTKADGILGILNNRRLTRFNVQENSFVACCLAQDAQFLCGQVIRLFLPE